MKSAKLICLVSLCSMFCMLLFVQSANAQEQQDNKVYGAADPLPSATAPQPASGDPLVDEIQAIIAKNPTHPMANGLRLLLAQHGSTAKPGMTGQPGTTTAPQPGTTTAPQPGTTGQTGTTTAPQPGTTTAPQPVVSKITVINLGPGQLDIKSADGSIIKSVSAKTGGHTIDVAGKIYLDAKGETAKVFFQEASAACFFYDGDDEKYYSLHPSQAGSGAAQGTAGTTQGSAGTAQGGSGAPQGSGAIVQSVGGAAPDTQVYGSVGSSTSTATLNSKKLEAAPFQKNQNWTLEVASDRYWIENK